MRPPSLLPPAAAAARMIALDGAQLNGTRYLAGVPLFFEPRGIRAHVRVRLFILMSIRVSGLCLPGKSASVYGISGSCGEG